MTAVALPWRGRVDYDPLRDKSYQHTGLGRALVDHLASLTSVGRAPKTISDKERYVGSLGLMYGAKQPHEFDAFDLMHWEANYNALFGKKDAKDATASKRVRRSHVNTFFRWCVRWDIIERNPVDRLDELSVQRGRVYDIYTDAEAESLCSLPLIDGALLALMFKGGLRRSEASNLQARNVLLEPAPGQLAILGGKGNKDRLVPMRKSLAQAVHDLLLTEGMGPADFFWYRRVNQGRTVKRERPIGDGSFQYWWDRVHRDAGVRRRNPHMTRHTFATRWLRDPHGRLETLSLVMGHSSIATTKDLYGHLDMRDVFADLALMED